MHSPPRAHGVPPRSWQCVRPHGLSVLRKILQQDSLKALEAHLRVDDSDAFLPLVDRDYELSIVAAVREGCSAPLIATLLRHGASVNWPGTDGLTASHWVAMSLRQTPEHCHNHQNDPLLRPTWITQHTFDTPPAPWAFVAAAPRHDTSADVKSTPMGARNLPSV